MENNPLIKEIIRDAENKTDFSLKAPDVSDIIVQIRLAAEGTAIVCHIFLSHEKSPLYFMKISRFPEQLFLPQEIELFETCQKILGAKLCEKFIKPICHGHVEGHYYILYPFKRTRKLRGAAWRLILKKPLFKNLTSWLTDAARITARAVSQAEYHDIVIKPLETVLARDMLPAEMTQCVKDSINGLAWENFPKKMIYQHKDMMPDNLIVEEMFPLKYYITDIASSSFSGLYFADIVDAALSFGLEKTVLINAIKRYADDLDLDFKLWKPLAICNNARRFLKLESCRERIYFTESRLMIFDIFKKLNELSEDTQ